MTGFFDECLKHRDLVHKVILFAEKPCHATFIILPGADWGEFSAHTCDIEATFLKSLLPAGTVKIGNFLRQKRFDKKSPNFGIIPLFRKESDCAIFHDFIELLRVWPIFSGTQSLNGNLKENSSVE